MQCADMHSPPAHNLLRLVAGQQGRDLDAWIVQMRRAGTSWRAISNLIADEYGQTISVWTLRRWYADEPLAVAS